VIGEAEARRALEALGRVDYGEAFIERQRRTVVLIDAGRAEVVQSGWEAGAGILAEVAGAVGYAHGPDRPEALLAAAATAKAVAASGGANGARARKAPQVAVQVPAAGTGRAADDDGGAGGAAGDAGGDAGAGAGGDGHGGVAADRAALVAALTAAEAAARASDPAIVQVDLDYRDFDQHVAVFAADGRRGADRRAGAYVKVRCAARRGGVLRTGVAMGSASGGESPWRRLDFLAVAREAARRAVVMLDAVPAPAGVMPVVIAGGRGGVLLHEACMHGLEADLVGRGTSIYAGRRGDPVASPVVTACDDPTLPGLFGSYTCDDEGVPARPTTIIAGGRLESYLCDRRFGARLGQGSTGNGRRDSYRSLALPRMSNTVLLPGPAAPEEVIAATRRGLYACFVAGGEADEVSGDFVFAVSEGYLIEDGRVTAPVYEATLAGNGPRVLRNIDMVAGDLAFAPGLCEKYGQYVPVGVGCPTLRVSELVVGGTRL